MIFIPRYGASASAVIVLVCESAIFITLVAGFARRGFHVAWLNSFFKPLAACAFASLILWAARGQSWEILFISLLGASVVYFSCLWFLRCFTDDEKRLAWEAVGFVQPYIRKLTRRIGTADH
jgi:hypothetical protein